MFATQHFVSWTGKEQSNSCLLPHCSPLERIAGRVTKVHKTLTLTGQSFTAWKRRYKDTKPTNRHLCLFCRVTSLIAGRANRRRCHHGPRLAHLTVYSSVDRAPLMLREKRARSLCSAAGTRPGVHSTLKTPFRILRFKFFSSKVPFCLKIQLKYFSTEDEYQSAAQLELGLPLQRSAALPVRSTPWILSWFCKSANLWVIKVR